MQAVLSFIFLSSKYLGEKISLLDQLTILSKVTFDDDPNYALLLEPGINEMDVALTLDIWTRTFPSSITAISNGYIQSENGLLLAGLKRDPSGTKLLCVENCQTTNESLDTQKTSIIKKSKFTIDKNLNSVGQIYGKWMEAVVRRLMDY